MATQRHLDLIFLICLQQPSHTPSWLTACFLGGGVKIYRARARVYKDVYDKVPDLFILP